MAVYKIYHKDGSILSDANGKEIEVHSIEYNGTWMGECFVTVTFENEAPISFSIGDYIEYRGERFEINYDPGKIKCASKGSYGGAFKYDSVKFNALSDELVRCDMLDLVLYDNNLHYTALPQFAFYVESLDDLLDRIQANLDELYGKAVWKLYSRNKECSIQRGCTAEGWESAYGAGTTDNVIDSTSISISDQNCWDALSLVNSKFDVNFIIRDRNVYVGTAGVPTANIFKYGKDKGLYEIEQNSESDQAIVTRLRAYGSNRNLPNHYYADLGSIPFLNITGDYHDGSTDSGLSVMMEDSVYAGMFTDIISDNGSNMKHCRIRGSIDGYEFDGVVELVKKDSTKSTTRLLVEGKAVCDAIKAKIDAGIVQVDFISGANKTKFNGNRINYVSNLPNNMACDRLMLPGFPNKSLSEWWNEQSEAKKAWLNPGGKGHDFSVNRHRPYVDSLNIDSIGVRPASVFFDQDDKVNGIVEIYPTIEGMEVDGVRIDEIYMGTNIEDDGRFGDGETVANVPIYLSPKVNFDIRALMQEDFTIHMKDGMCAGREFKVAGCTKEKDGSWKLMIERKPDDSLNLYFPYNDFQIKKGDHFVLSGIELPDAYVEAASEKLLRYCIAYLDKNDYTRYVYQPKVDEIFMARQHDTAMADASGLTKSLYLTLKEGDIMLFNDDDLGIDAEITIDQLTIKEEDGKIPTYEITLREEKEVGTIQKIQNQISSITNGNGGSFTGGTGGGGLSSSQIKNLIDAIGSDRFLSKLNPDTAAGVITFLQGTNWGNFTSETGAAMTVDPNTGQTYMEVDRLKVRLKAFFEKLEIQKVGFVGGKLIVTKGQGVDILDVENIYDSEGNVSAYRCYFLGEQEGRKIDNLLRVKDQMICKDFNVSEGSTDGATNKYYWRLVTAVSSDVVKRGNYVCHWVDLSATDCDTNSDIPEIGDTICHLGNREDTDRQGAEILSVVDANSPSFTIYSGINSYSLVNKEYIDMGVAGGKAFCNIYGSTYIGDRNRENGYISWDYDKEENVWKMRVKGTIDISSPLSSGGTIGGAITDAANAYKGEFNNFVNNTYAEDKKDFYNQLDGKVETWYQKDDPKDKWAAADYSKHKGDIWYNDSENKSYRWTGTAWVELKDQAAIDAKTLAESKKRVFTTTALPTPPYDKKDLWVQGENGDIMVCVKEKTAGETASASDWAKASKYTDDTKAKEALTKVGDLQTDVTELGDSINTLTNTTLPALSDGIITTSEKENIRQALMQVQKECVDVINAYTNLTVNYKSIYDNIAANVRTDFATAYTNLMGSATLSSDGTITYTSGQGGAYGALVDNINALLNKEGNLTTNEIATINNNIANFNIKYNDFQNRLVVVRNDIEKTLDTRITKVDEQLGGYAYLKKIVGGKTTIDGGLVLTTMLGTGYEVTGGAYKIMSGISGLYETAKSVAIWAGGSMIDKFVYYDAENKKFNVPDDVTPANFLVRMDGTGYAAGGNFWWDNDGKIHADPQSFLINEQYVGNVMQLFQLHYKVAGDTAFTNVDYVTPTRMFNGLELSDLGLKIGDTAKFYIKDGVLFLEGDLAVTGGITMYATDGVTSGLLDQVYAILDSSKFEIENGVITIKGEIGDGKVKGATLGGVAVTLNANGILEFDAYPTTLPASDVYAWAKAATKPTYSWGEITDKPSTFTPVAHTHDDRYYTETEIDTKLGLKLDTSLKGVANGLATLDASGKVPSAQLPSYVDDVIEHINKASFPTTGESGKIYIDQTTNLTYRWGGTAYVEISQSLALGETSSTAYAGDKGKQNAADIAALKTGKADKATTLSGYGITDAYTKTEVNTKLTDGSVTKIGTKDVGSATLPIYLKAGVPTAVGTSLAVDITGNSATTSKLKTAVTLWGQSFDGSKAITGNLTNVGTITPTGEDLKVVGNLIVTGGIVMYADDGATIESGFAALLAAHIDGVTIKYNEAQQKIYSVMTGIKVNGATYKPSETDGYITIPDYPTSLDWENIENKPSSFTPSSHTHTFASLTSKPTTLSGYGITDAKIANGVITLGTATITPLTAHQTVTLASGTNNGTLKLTVGSKTTDNIAVKGLGSAAYTASSAYAAASHTHSQYLVASSLDGYVNALTDNTSANVFVTAISKSGKTLSYTKSFTKKSLTAASHSGWSSADTDKLIIPDMSFIAYWNGAYNSSGGSNLAYCNKGAFGDMATAAKSSYYTKTEVNTKLGDGSVTKLGTGTTGAANTPIYWSNGKPAAVTLVDTANNLINSLTTGTTTPVDADYYIAQYAGGGTTTTTYHRRPHSALYAYIKGKAEGTWAISISGNAATASKLGTANVGSGTQHFYLSGGTATASTSTVGSASKPMYLKAGVMTACSYDFTSYLPLAGGTMAAGARISHADGNMYLGRSDNNGWVMCQDLCSQTAAGDGYWSLRTNGVLHAVSGVFSGNTTVGSLTVGDINVTKSSTGILKIDGNLVVTGGITMYATDGVASGLMEQILVDGTTIGKKADGTLYAINTGNVRSIIMGSTTYTPNDSGAVTLPEKVTWANIEGKPSTFAPSAHTHSYLPLAGGTLTGALVIQETTSAASYAMSGGAFHAGYANIILRGNSSTGVSGIVFTSSKGTTNINQTSDRGFIQFHAYGVAPAAEGTDPTLSTSGEINRLVIGVGNDGDDMVYIQTPASTGLRHLVGTSAHVILDSGNFGDYAAAKSHTHAISQITNLQATLDGKAAASHTHSYLPLSGGTLTGNLYINTNLYGPVVGSNPRNIYGSGFYFFNCNSSTTSTYNFGLYQWNDEFQFTYRTSADNKHKGNAFTIQGSDGQVAFVKTPKVGSTLVSLAGHTHAYLPLAGGTMTGALNVRTGGIWVQGGSEAGSDNTRMSLVSGMPSGLAFNTSKRGVRIYSNAIAFADPYNGNTNNDSGWIRHIETSANAGVLEIAVGDDAANESIVVRRYNTSSAVANEAYLLNSSGNTSFPGTVTAPTFSGALSGNASSATKLTSSAGSATLPIYFSDGKPVACTASSVFSNLSNSGNNISVTVAGQNRTLTVGYASAAGNADTLDGYHWDSFPTAGVYDTGNFSNFYDRSFIGSINASASSSPTGSKIWFNTVQIAHRNGGGDGAGYISQIAIGMTGYKDCMWFRGSRGNSWTSVITSANIGSQSVSYATSASKWQTARKITLSGSVTGSVYIDGSGDVTLATTTNHTHNYAGSASAGGAAYSTNKINSRGNLTAYAEGSTTMGESGVNLYNVYNNGYPVSYGNLLHIYGSGAGQLLAEWCGNSTLGHLYYRSKRDNSENGWSAWGKVAFVTDTVANSDTCDGLHVHGGRNNEANKIVRTDGNGYLQVGYINSSNGDEGNNWSPARVWGTNGSDSYMRTYLTSALSVNYAASAGNADTVDGEHSSAFAHRGAHNNLMADDNEFTFASSGFSGTVYINWRTAGGFNGNITEYKLCNGAQASLGTIIHSGNYSSYALPLSGGTMTGTIYANDGTSNTGIKFKSNNANLNALGNQHLILGSAIRFGDYNTWDWNVWAGLKYEASSKTIYLGLADGTTFNANSAQSGGSLRFPGVSTVYAPTFSGSLSGNASTASAVKDLSNSRTTYLNYATDGVMSPSWLCAWNTRSDNTYEIRAISPANMLTVIKALPLAGGKLTGSLEINATASGSSYNEGVRIHPAGNWGGVILCERSNSGSSGTSTNTWSIYNNEGTFGMYKNGATINASVCLGYKSDLWTLKPNLLVTGGITMYSDLRKKNILSNEVLSVKEIAAAPLFRHTYKSDDNQYIHVGTSAQYWSGIHEDWFTRKDSEGYYQMELQNLGVAMGISLAREIVKYESKTDKKIKLMKKKINDLEEANKALDARIKELEERRTA